MRLRARQSFSSPSAMTARKMSPTTSIERMMFRPSSAVAARMATTALIGATLSDETRVRREGALDPLVACGRARAGVERARVLAHAQVVAGAVEPALTQAGGRRGPRSAVPVPILSARLRTEG